MFDNFIYYLKVILQGLPDTLSLGILGIISAGLLAVIFSCLLSINSCLIKKIIRTYIIIFTGSPLLVQLFLIYYGPSQFGDVLSKVPTFYEIISSPWFCAYLALTLNSAAYTTQIFYGALKSVPQGQWQACEALGMNKIQTLKIIMPYALKRALSTYSNEVVFVVKGTALASMIPVMDIMGYSNQLNGDYYDFSIFVVAGSVYLLINGLLSTIMRIIEKKALTFEN
ncbi:arginine ABC transporter permease ArtM [Gilliamella sp. B2776]|uniref:arginine ABC transporter permease ArtM n=1 Tax=unclassified Gilliamella TaxID=2685620 RepID=UPI002269D793|nr:MULTISPECIES: arginine ABC transporter permease ArtM [unclassified Gilliamella]MCX8650763.1 arginine ABC transporter permease ArtM [Gilliamella sp. B2779]MCX8654077.1 arginine ABC transporter permease ArtM [Gilliamella sp. B2737]MCX8692611.1 arginine ABC transporter permease ArtM [Gilliamella sp. B2776]MCX8701409.1 arginine ABC transporter permease ArtM [Gilliamella sp. B2840]MCX8703752.1 arginine ABC transporter permease ArtM [Gilliamella sp. B2781]